MNWHNINYISGSKFFIFASVAHTLFVFALNIGISEDILNISTKLAVVVNMIVFIYVQSSYVICPGPLKGIKSLKQFYDAHVFELETELMKIEYINHHSIKDVTEASEKEDILFFHFKKADDSLSRVRYFLTTILITALIFYIAISFIGFFTVINGIYS